MGEAGNGGGSAGNAVVGLRIYGRARRGYQPAMARNAQSGIGTAGYCSYPAAMRHEWRAELLRGL